MAKLEMFRGDTRRLTISIVDEDGAALDLTNYKVWFTAKRLVTDTDASAVIAKDTDANGITRDAVVGDAVVLLDAADTSSLTARTVLHYDVQTKNATTSEIVTVETGTLIVKLDVTRATT